MLPHTVRLTVHAQLHIEAKHSFELLMVPAYFYVKMCKMRISWQVWIIRRYGCDGLRPVG